MKTLRPAVRPSPLLLIVGLFAVLLSHTATGSAAPAGGPGDTIYGLVASNTLIRFAAANPAVIEATTPIIGLPSGTTVVGIDFRVATSQLYAIGITGTLSSGYGRVYTINLDTGAASLVGSTPFSTTLPAAANYAMDFNPLVDRLRLVNELDHNLRVNPNTGDLVQVDAALNRPSNDPYMAGMAYYRSPVSGSPTTLYGIDYFLDQLVLIGGINGSPSPNLGVVSQVGPLGLSTQSAFIGFDISIAGAAYASMNVGGVYRLYALNLTTGTATLIGPIDNGATIIYDIAIQPPPYTLFVPLALR